MLGLGGDVELVGVDDERKATMQIQILEEERCYPRDHRIFENCDFT